MEEQWNLESAAVAYGEVDIGCCYCVNELGVPERSCVDDDCFDFAFGLMGLLLDDWVKANPAHLFEITALATPNGPRTAIPLGDVRVPTHGCSGSGLLGGFTSKGAKKMQLCHLGDDLLLRVEWQHFDLEGKQSDWSGYWLITPCSTGRDGTVEHECRTLPSNWPVSDPAVAGGLGASYGEEKPKGSHIAIFFNNYLGELGAGWVVTFSGTGESRAFETFEEANAYVMNYGYRYLRNARD